MAKLTPQDLSVIPSITVELYGMFQGKIYFGNVYESNVIKVSELGNTLPDALSYTCSTYWKDLIQQSENQGDRIIFNYSNSRMSEDMKSLYIDVVPSLNAPLHPDKTIQVPENWVLCG